MPMLARSLLILALLPCPALACSLCGTLGRKESLLSEYERAHAAAVGTLANPKLGAGKAGLGTTEFRVEKVIKPDARLTAGETILLSRYLPVLSPKEPPRYVMFFQPVAGKLEATTGRQVHSAAHLDYLLEARSALGKSRADLLVHVAKYLDHRDSAVAEEAFMEFARATDQDVAAAAKRLSPDVFRKLLREPPPEPERLSLFAYLLGATGTADDAELLQPYLDGRDERSSKAVEGVLAGYILLRPEEGWDRAYRTLADARQSFLVRFGVVRTLRFLACVDFDKHRANLLHAAGLMVPDAELADSAVVDLQKWKAWDHTRLILAQYGKPSHAAPITRNAIVRYALACGRPEAKAFLDQVRRQEPQLVRELEEDLAFERGQ